MNRFPTERPADFVDDLKVPAAPDALFFIVREGKLLLSDAGELPSGHSLAGQAVIALGRLGERPVFALPLTGEAPAGAQLVGLRQCFGVLPDGLFGLAGLAVQLVDFQRSHQFCGACGTPTQPGHGDRARRCPSCGLRVYPRVAPAIIVLISRGTGPDTEFLLLRDPRQAPDVFTTLAGFVEPSETLEAAVHREVGEEVGVKVRQVQYRFSQPWPFPHSLMLAFTAEYAGGDIVPQPGEVEEAQWFTVSDLPRLPPTFTASRRLLDDALATLRLSGDFATT